MKPVERAGYLAHAQTARYKRRVTWAEAISARAADHMQRPYISMSFGKDSLAMTEIVLRAWPDAPVVYVDCGEFDEWPDTPRVIEAWRATHPCRFVRLEGPSIVDYYRRAGHVYYQDHEETPEARRIQREYGESLERVILDWARAESEGCDGGFIGMRAEESHWREFQLRKRGPIYYAEGRGMWTCCPLADWSARDVWACIVAHDLPYNELYDLHPRGRELARNGAMIGTRGSAMGRLSWLKQMYPDWWLRLVAEFGDVAREL